MLSVSNGTPLLGYMMTSSDGNVSRVTGLLCGNSPVTGEFPAQRSVTRSFDVFFDIRPNKRLIKHSRGWWFETPPCPLWRRRNDLVYWWVLGHNHLWIYDEKQFYYLRCWAIIWSEAMMASLTLSQSTLAGPVYTGMPLEYHWLYIGIPLGVPADICRVHWNTAGKT